MERIFHKKVIRGIFWSYMAILLVLTIIPPQTDQTRSLSHHYLLMIRWDYLLHAIAYLPWPILVHFSYRNPSKAVSRGCKQEGLKWFALALLIAVGFEFLQLVIPYRTFNINDLTGNVGGVLTGSLLLLIVTRSHSRPSVSS